MTKLYLITGFLGAGKTTFLKRILSVFSDKKIALIINEFGKVGVDGSLIANENYELKEINNGSIFCSCKVEEFETSVHSFIEKNDIDIIFIEASGLADPSEVRNIFTNDRYPNLEYGGTICIVDALRFHKVYASTRVCKMQLAISDVVVINKIDIASEEQIDNIVEISKAQNENRKIIKTSHGEIGPDFFSEINVNKANPSELTIRTKDITLQKLSIQVCDVSYEELVSFLKMICEETYRIKGFVFIKNELHFVDCVGPMVNLYKYNGNSNDEGTITVLYGNGLKAKSSINNALKHFDEGKFKM